MIWADIGQGEQCSFPGNSFFCSIVVLAVSPQEVLRGDIVELGICGTVRDPVLSGPGQQLVSKDVGDPRRSHLTDGQGRKGETRAQLFTTKWQEILRQHLVRKDDFLRPLIFGPGNGKFLGSLTKGHPRRQSLCRTIRRALEHATSNGDGNVEGIGGAVLSGLRDFFPNVYADMCDLEITHVAIAGPIAFVLTRPCVVLRDNFWEMGIPWLLGKCPSDATQH